MRGAAAGDGDLAVPSRLKSIERLASLYRAMNHAEEMSLEQAVATLREAEMRIESQREQLNRSSREGHEALDAGDHARWQIHEAQQEFIEWRFEDLLELRKRRELLMREATESYKASRMQLEQMESLLRDTRSQRDLEQARVDQRESDDRYLSRQRWLAKRGLARDRAKRMNAS